ARTCIWGSTGARLVVAGILLTVLALTRLAGVELPRPYVQYVSDYVNDSYLGFETLAGATLRSPRILAGSFSIGVSSLLAAIGLVSFSLAVGLVLLDLPSRWRCWRSSGSWRLTLSPGDQAGLCGLVLMGLLVGVYPID